MQVSLLLSMDGRQLLDPGWVDKVVFYEEFVVLSVVPSSAFSAWSTRVAVHTNCSTIASSSWTPLCRSVVVT